MEGRGDGGEKEEEMEEEEEQQKEGRGDGGGGGGTNMTINITGWKVERGRVSLSTQQTQLYLSHRKKILCNQK